MVDPFEKLLFIDGVPQHLPAKEFETLLLLIENNGHALSKDEMMSAVWPDAHVEEGNLAKQISRLRKILNSDDEQLIQTIPKHGYRFDADLRRTEEPVILEKRTVKRVSVSLPGSRIERPVLKGSIARRPYLVFAILVALLVIAAAGYYFFTIRPAAPTLRRSVAVLPFKSNPADGDDEYFGLGLTDALVTKLSRISTVTVRPTSATREYGAKDPIVAGRELGVDAVVEGNIQHVGERIRVTVQLVDVQDGGVMWAGKFDEKFTDIFSVQDKISEQVAHELVPDLTRDERMLVKKRYATNADAHAAYVRGRVFWNRRTANDLREAIRQFEDAIAKDPAYALAYAGLADSYSLLADYSGASPRDSYEKARDVALRALELDGDLAEAHTSLAYVNMYYFWDWQRADNEYREAIRLNPNYATAHQWYSEYLTAMGRFDEALGEIHRAQEIDPLSPVINAGEVWVLYFARRYDEAIRKGRNLADMYPEFAEIHEYLKRCYDQKGMYRDAIAERQTRRKLAGFDVIETPALKRAASASGAEAYWSARLAQELDDSKHEVPAAFDMAEIYSMLGDKDKAFEWLDRAFDERLYTVMYLKTAPDLDPLRSDPRFDDLLRRTGLAE